MAQTADSGNATAPKAQSTSTTKHISHRQHKKAAPPPLVLPPLPPGPLHQVPMDQIPETAPKVSFEKGQLTIVAQNSTLGDILKQVRQLTGASIELPPSGAPERVVTQLGPGAPRDVLAALLNGTNFNYVMLGSNSDPSAVASVLLTSKPSGGGPDNAGQTVANAYQNAPGMPIHMPPPGGFRQQVIAQQQQQQEQTAEADDASTDDSANTDDSADQTQPQPGQPAQQPDQPDQQENQPNAGPKTPEQLLQMMRQGQQPGAMTPPPQQQPQPQQ